MVTEYYYRRRDTYREQITQIDEEIEHAYESGDIEALAAAETASEEIWMEYMNFIRRRD